MSSRHSRSFLSCLIKIRLISNFRLPLPVTLLQKEISSISSLSMRPPTRLSTQSSTYGQLESRNKRRCFRFPRLSKPGKEALWDFNKFQKYRGFLKNFLWKNTSKRLLKYINKQGYKCLDTISLCVSKRLQPWTWSKNRPTFKHEVSVASIYSFDEESGDFPTRQRVMTPFILFDPRIFA